VSGATSIEWTDVTWNPVRGCSRVSEGCRHCYAETFAARGLPSHRSPRTGDSFATHTGAGPRWTGKVELIPEKLDEPLNWRKPRRVFVNSMSDLFHEKLSDEAIAAVFGVMAACPQHTFQVLTKRPERMREWVFGSGEALTFDAGEKLAGDNGWCHAHEGEAWPLPNVHLGVSVEDQATADERIPLLLQTPAALRFVSYEPALGPIEFPSGWLSTEGSYLCPACGESGCNCGAIDWLIVGGESGPGARPCDLAWIRAAVEQCRDAGVPVFVKQLGAWPLVYRSEAERMEAAGQRVAWDDSGENTSARLVLRSRKGNNLAEWPEDLRVRELPGGAG